MPSLPSSAPLYLSLSIRASLWSSCVVLPLLALTWMSAVLAITDRRSTLFQVKYRNPTTPRHSSDTCICQSGCRNVAPTQCMAEIMCLDGGKYDNTSWSRNRWLRCFNLVMSKWHEGILKIETCGIKCVSCEVLGASWHCITKTTENYMKKCTSKNMNVWVTGMI